MEEYLFKNRLTFRGKQYFDLHTVKVIRRTLISPVIPEAMRKVIPEMTSLVAIASGTPLPVHQGALCDTMPGN